jgi:hypothetical protein
VARRRTDALLLAAAARAGGGLLALNVTGCPEVTYNTLRAVLRGNPGLAELRCCSALGLPESGTSNTFLDVSLDTAEIEALLRVAPQLRLLATNASCTTTALATQLLSNAPPFAALRVRHLQLGVDTGAPAQPLAELDALAAAVATHSSLDELQFNNLALDDAVPALVDAALACRLRSLVFVNCNLSPVCAPALARLLRHGALSELEVLGDGEPLLDAAAAAVMGDALRGNTTLRYLELRDVGFWNDTEAAEVLLRGVAHSSVRSLCLVENRVGGGRHQAAGDALGELIIANSASLRELEVNNCALGDVGLEPLVHALPHNTHLRVLDCSHNGMSEECARADLLPAVHANTSLRVLTADAVDLYCTAREAEMVVGRRRRAADLAGAMW